MLGSDEDQLGLVGRGVRRLRAREAVAVRIAAQMVERYGSNAQVARPVTTTSSQGVETGLIRASTLRGRPVNAVDRKVGDIENIIIDLERGTAAALLDSSGAFTGTTAKYLVPLSGLTFAHPRQDALGTTLTRADFDRAVPFSFAR